MDSQFLRRPGGNGGGSNGGGGGGGGGGLGNLGIGLSGMGQTQHDESAQIDQPNLTLSENDFMHTFFENNHLKTMTQHHMLFQTNLSQMNPSQVSGIDLNQSYQLAEVGGLSAYNQLQQSQQQSQQQQQLQLLQKLTQQSQQQQQQQNQHQLSLTGMHLPLDSASFGIGFNMNSIGAQNNTQNNIILAGNTNNSNNNNISNLLGQNPSNNSIQSQQGLDEFSKYIGANQYMEGIEGDYMNATLQDIKNLNTGTLKKDEQRNGQEKKKSTRQPGKSTRPKNASSKNPPTATVVSFDQSVTNNSGGAGVNQQNHTSSNLATTQNAKTGSTTTGSKANANTSQINTTTPLIGFAVAPPGNQQNIINSGNGGVAEAENADSLAQQSLKHQCKNTYINKINSLVPDLEQLKRESQFIRSLQREQMFSDVILKDKRMQESVRTRGACAKESDSSQDEDDQNEEIEADIAIANAKGGNKRQSKQLKEKQIRNRESAVNSRKRKKIYVELLEKKVQDLTEELEFTKKALEQKTQSLKKMKVQSQLAGLSRNQAQLIDKLEKCIEQNGEENEINLLLDSLRFRLGASGKERVAAINYFFKQILDICIPTHFRYILYTANSEQDMFSNNPHAPEEIAHRPEWRNELIAYMAINDSQRSKILKFRKKFQQEKKNLEQLIIELQQVKKNIQAKTISLEEMVDNIRNYMNPMQSAKFLSVMEKNRLRKEISNIALWNSLRNDKLDDEFDDDLFDQNAPSPQNNPLPAPILPTAASNIITPKSIQTQVSDNKQTFPQTSVQQQHQQFQQQQQQQQAQQNFFSMNDFQSPSQAFSTQLFMGAKQPGSNITLPNAFNLSHEQQPSAQQLPPSNQFFYSLMNQDQQQQSQQQQQQAQQQQQQQQQHQSQQHQQQLQSSQPQTQLLHQQHHQSQQQQQQQSQLLSQLNQQNGGLQLNHHQQQQQQQQQQQLQSIGAGNTTGNNINLGYQINLNATTTTSLVQRNQGGAQYLQESQLGAKPPFHPLLLNTAPVTGNTADPAYVESAKPKKKTKPNETVKSEGI